MCCETERHDSTVGNWMGGAEPAGRMMNCADRAESVARIADSVDPADRTGCSPVGCPQILALKQANQFHFTSRYFDTQHF